MRALFAPIGLLFLVVPIRADAADTWVTVRPGVDWLHRTTGGSVPQDLHAVRIDLFSPQIGVRASANEAGAERGVRTSVFAEDSDVLVAVNGDWSNGFTPVSLAIGNGDRWHDHYNDPSISGDWGYVGCDVWNACTIDALPPLGTAWWFQQPEISPTRFWNAVGANGVLLYLDGVRQNGCYDGCGGDTCRHPRTAVCTTLDGFLWLIAVDGRRTGASGMRCSEVRDLVEEFGCHDAAMLDGGGSTTMWIEGDVVNEPSDGAQRVVANHLGITYADAPDPACVLPQGAWCDGTHRMVCNGSQLVSDGDCGAFGLTCGSDGTWAFCVDPRCPMGDGQAAACLDGDTIESCTDGVYGVGECGAFGLVCGGDAGAATCMDPRCVAGPDGTFCASPGVRAACAAGVYSEQPCPEGRACDLLGTAATCIDARCAGAPDSLFCTPEGALAICTAGEFTLEDCVAAGRPCAADPGGAFCTDPACVGGPNGRWCADGYTLGRCSGGAHALEPCPADHRCEPNDLGAACVYAPPPDPTPVPDPEGGEATPDPAGGTAQCDGCDGGGGGAGAGAALWLVACRRRRAVPWSA